MKAVIPIAQVVDALDPALVGAQRWFRHKGVMTGSFAVADGWPVMHEGTLYGWWLLVRVPAKDEEALYQIPVVLSDREPYGGAALLGVISSEAGKCFILDGACDALMVGDLISRVHRRKTFPLKKGTLLPETFDSTAIVSAQVEDLGYDTSNTLCRLNGRLLFKLYRCLDAGGRREADLLAALARQGTEGIPAVKAVVSYGGKDGMAWALALIQEWVHEGQDAWSWLTGTLASGPSDVDSDLRRMAEAVAAIHRGFMKIGTGAWTVADTKCLKNRIREQVARLQATAREKALQFLSRDLDAALLRVKLAQVNDGGIICPVHGDLHLGQMLRHGQRYLILDFEGEPLVSSEARTAWHSPLKDVAGMLRSFDYAAAFARRQCAPGGKEEWERWVDRAGDVFLDTYVRQMPENASLNPPGRRDLLALYLLEKAAYEIAYELQSRPEWLEIPHGGLRRVLKKGLSNP